MDITRRTINNALMRVRVKICGITRPEDALAAARAGADAIGMVFYPRARRCISLDNARQILRALPAFITPVALFVDQDLHEITTIAHDLGIRHIQLHGHEPPSTVAALRNFTILKALRADPAALRAELDDWREAAAALDLRNLQGFVLETPAPPSADGSTAMGGTGLENNFEAIAALQSAGAFAGLPPIIAAGGLRPENVGRVVELLHPWAVDVSSGVELEYGNKSAAKIEQFINEVAWATGP